MLYICGNLKCFRHVGYVVKRRNGCSMSPLYSTGAFRLAKLSHRPRNMLLDAMLCKHGLARMKRDDDMVLPLSHSDDQRDVYA